MISELFRESEAIYNLQKIVWMLQLDKSDSLSKVKKICDDIIKWIDEDKKEPKKDKKPFVAFSDSLMVVAIIGELKSLVLLLQVSPSIIDKALEKIETVQDESQRREILKNLVNHLEAIMPADVEHLKKISASLNKSGSPLTKAEAIKIINVLIQTLKDEAIPNENLLKRIKSAESNEEISWLLQKLIDDNNSFTDYLDRLKNQIHESMKIDHLSPPQFYKRLKNMLEGIVSGKVLVDGPKDDPSLIDVVKILTENQSDASKTSVSLEWADNAKPKQIEDADIIITLSKRAMSIVKHFEFNVILSDGNRIILEKIPSSVPGGQEARGEDLSLTAAEAVKLAKEAISRLGQEPPIGAVKSMFKSILRDKNYTSEPVSYLSDFKKIVEQCSEEVRGSDIASLFYYIKLSFDIYAKDKKFDSPNLVIMQYQIKLAFEDYLKFILAEISPFSPEFHQPMDVTQAIEFIKNKNDIAIISFNERKIDKEELLASLEFIKEVTASSAITKQVGGIDFRSMNMLIQPTGSFSGLDFSPVRLSSSALEAMDLDKIFGGIKQMTSKDMLASPLRLKEYISACIFKGKIGEKADEFVLSMLEVFQLQAEEGIESAALEREAVVLADTRRYVLPEKRLAASNGYGLN